MLHLIFTAPLQTATLQRIGADDSVLFLENAVLHLLKNSVKSAELTHLVAKNRLFVLLSDIESYGISVEELVQGIEVIDYSQWVSLTCQHHLIQSWY